MSDDLRSKSHVKQRLGVSMATVDRLIKRGELPTVRVSERAVRISESAIRDYVERRTERRGSQ